MHAINNLCDVYEHRFKNQKYDLSDLDLLTLIQNTSTEEFDLLENQIKDMVSYNTWSQYQAYKLMTDESNPDFIMNLIANQHKSISLSDMELI